jgi:hypothetical protein
MAVRLLLVLGLAALVGGCGPPVREFATLQQARAAGVIQQGWLPDVLPVSTALIRLQADSRTRTASGQFHFASADYPALVAPLGPVAAPTGDKATDAFITRKELRGYSPYSLRADGRQWLFMCAQNKGRCYFSSRPLD